MRHAWILNHYATPPGLPGGIRHHGMASHLPECGWRATLLVASVTHHSDRQLLDEGLTHAVADFEGVPHLRLRVPRYGGKAWRRVLNMAAYTGRALDPRCTRGIDPPDVVMGSTVHPFAALAGSELARRHGVPFVFEVRDLWPETLIARGALTEHHPAAVAFRALERHLYRRATRIVSLLPRAHEYIARYGIPRERVVWIPNGVDWREYADAAGPRLAPRRGERTFDLMYFGAHGQSNDLDVLLRAFQLAEQRWDGRRPLRLRLIGEGPLKPRLMALADELGLQRVSFEPLVPRGDVPALAAEADAFVYVVRDLGRLYRYGISLNKSYDYLAAGRPVIAAASAGNDPVAEAGAGLSVPPEPDPLADAIVTMAGTHHARRAAMGRAGRRYVQRNHDYGVLAGRLAGVFDDCLREAAGVC